MDNGTQIREFWTVFFKLLETSYLRRTMMIDRGEIRIPKAN